jgi:hypothetical protein
MNFMDEVLKYKVTPTLSHSEIIEVVDDYLEHIKFKIICGKS